MSSKEHRIIFSVLRDGKHTDYHKDLESAQRAAEGMIAKGADCTIKQIRSTSSSDLKPMGTYLWAAQMKEWIPSF